MPYSEKITISRDGNTDATDIASNNPLAVTMIDGFATIKWGDTNYAVGTDSEKILGTKYKFTMSPNLIGVFIPRAPATIEAITFRPMIVKNGDSLKVSVINFNASVAMNVTANEVLGYMVFVDGKTKLA